MEILLAVLGNVKIVALVVGVALLLGLAIGLVKAYVELEEQEAWVGSKRLIKWIVLCAAIACIPDIDDVWRVRIALIKYQLASPDNVQKGAETIERIAHKLECRYLGGDRCETEKEEK